MNSAEHGPERSNLTDLTPAEIMAQATGDTVQSMADELSPGQISDMIADARSGIEQRVIAKDFLNEEITAITLKLDNLVAALALANDKNPGL